MLTSGLYPGFIYNFDGDAGQASLRSEGRGRQGPQEVQFNSYAALDFGLPSCNMMNIINGNLS